MAFDYCEAQILGFLPRDMTAGPSTLALSAANTWLAQGFVLADDRTLNSVRAFLSAVAGTLTSLECHVFSDVSGSPSASLSSTSTVTAMPTGAGVVEFTGLTQALTKNTQYWLVFKNTTGTPGTNFPTYRFNGNQGLPHPLAGSVGTWGWNKWHTTDGASWVSNVINGANFRLGFSSGYAGFPFSQMAGAAVGQGVYSTREVGVKFTWPATWPTTNIRGITSFCRLTGSPTQNPFYKLYSGSSPSLVASTNEIPKANISTTNGWRAAYFTSAQVLTPGTIYRVVLAEQTQSDTSSNWYGCAEYTIDNDADSKSLMPFGGTLHRTYYDGSSWTDTDTGIMGFGLIPDTAGEFTVSGGGGLILPRSMNGGLV